MHCQGVCAVVSEQVRQVWHLILYYNRTVALGKLFYCKLEAHSILNV